MRKDGHISSSNWQFYFCKVWEATILLDMIGALPVSLLPGPVLSPSCCDSSLAMGHNCLFSRDLLWD